MDITTPTFHSAAFHCPLCNTYAHMKWTTLIFEPDNCALHTAKCSKCKKDSIWRSTIDKFNRNESPIMIYPDVKVNILPEADMPEDVKQDFEEAKSIYYQSPKSAAALLRLALQKLCKHLGESGENINADLKSLVAKGTIALNITKAADTVRIVGNNAVHPGTMNDEDIDFIAGKMFNLINFIVKKTITEPKELEKIYEMTPESARAAVTRRDSIDS